MKNPPILISVLGFFAALAGFGQLFFGLRILGFDWFGLLGDLRSLEAVGLWGWLAIIVGIAGSWPPSVCGGSSRGRAPWPDHRRVGLLQAVLAFLQFPGPGIGFAWR